MLRKKLQETRPISRRIISRRRTQQTARRHPLLILECNSEKLAKQDLAIVRDLRPVLNMLHITGKIITISATTEAKLLAVFYHLVKEKMHFDIVVVVAHGNRDKIILTSDRELQWRAFAKWLEPLKPKQIYLLACKAGQHLPVKDLFNQIGSLQEVHASPDRINKKQGICLGLITVLHAMKVKSLNEARGLIKAFNFALADGVIFSWTRSEVEMPIKQNMMMWNVMQKTLLPEPHLRKDASMKSARTRS